MNLFELALYPFYWLWCRSLCKRRGWFGYSDNCPRCDREYRDRRDEAEKWDW